MSLIDEMVKKKRSAQNPKRRWYWKMRAEGKCVVCGNPLDSDYKVRCHACHEKRRTKLRKKLKYKAWSPGGRGRKPMDYVEVGE